MKVYYNEHDEFAANWLTELGKAGKIPFDFDEPLCVDTWGIEHVAQAMISGAALEDPQRRSILAAARHVHLFAGIGGWPLSLQMAGFPSEGRVWTGSCPCQPFSQAGQGKGESDSRHLWPDMRSLISIFKPPAVFGEQVASPLGRKWFSGVRTDLEALGYRVGCADLCAAGVSAPHIRQRLFWGAWLPNAEGRGLAELWRASRERRSGHADGGCENGGVPDAECGGRQSRTINRAGAILSRTDGGWDDYDIIPCADGKARRIEPGLSPLVDGVPGRVGLLRGYGNAIVPQVAAAFVTSFMDSVVLEAHQC